MKAIKLIIVILFIVCVVLFLGVFIFLKTVDLDRFRTQITRQASKAIGREVAMERVAFKFSVTKGVTLRISGLSIMDSSDFAEEPMLYIDSSHLDVDLLSFIMRRQILVSRVEFDSPRINMVRNSEGKINFQELDKKPKESPQEASGSGDGASSAEKSSSKEEGSGAKDFDFKEMLIAMIRMKDGTFVFTDHLSSPPATVSLADLEFEVSNVSFDAPFPFDIKASLWSSKQNIQLNGLARIGRKKRQTRIDDLKIRTDLADIIPERLYEQVPVVKDLGFSGGFGGKLVVNIHQMIFEESGLLVLSLEGRVTDGRMQLADMPVPIVGLNAHFEMTESNIEIKEIAMPLASGTIKAAVRMVEYFTEQKFSGSLDLRDIQLGELARQVNLPAKLEGQFHANFNITGKGVDQEAIKMFLTGEGTAKVENGKVIDVNILKLVLSKILLLPDLANEIEANSELALSKISFISALANEIELNLPDKYKEKLKVKDTVLEKVSINAKIREGFVFINEADLSAEGFLVIANGKMDFDQNLNLNADLYISSDLSKDLMVSASELSYFLDDQKRIHIPFRPYNGKLENFKMYPDVKDIGKEVIRNKGREELKKVIFKALDIDNQPASQDPSQDGSSQTDPTSGQEPGAAPKRQPTAEEILIDNIFDMIPIFK